MTRGGLGSDLSPFPFHPICSPVLSPGMQRHSHLHSNRALSLELQKYMHPLCFTSWANSLILPKATVPVIPITTIAILLVTQIYSLSLLWLLPSLPLSSAAKSYRFSLQCFTSTYSSPFTAWSWVRPSSSNAQTSHRISSVELLVHIPLLEHHLLSCPGSSLVPQKNHKRHLRPWHTASP